jgi:two-component system OmpR family response regulator
MVGSVNDQAPVRLKRVVIADDDPDIRALVAITVRKAGFDLVTSAEDGNSAWAAIQREKPDLAILDISMPGITGLEVCRLIHAGDDPGHTTVLLLTASVDDVSRHAGVLAGADAFMSKPFSPRALTTWLGELAAEGSRTP